LIAPPETMLRPSPMCAVVTVVARSIATAPAAPTDDEPLPPLPSAVVALGVLPAPALVRPPLLVAVVSPTPRWAAPA